VTDETDPICRICGEPIRAGEPRYREPEGDVHADCRRKAQALALLRGAYVLVPPPLLDAITPLA
jgi:hypothetical protein